MKGYAASAAERRELILMAPGHRKALEGACPVPYDFVACSRYRERKKAGNGDGEVHSLWPCSPKSRSRIRHIGAVSESVVLSVKLKLRTKWHALGRFSPCSVPNSRIPLHCGCFSLLCTIFFEFKAHREPHSLVNVLHMYINLKTPGSSPRQLLVCPNGR